MTDKELDQLFREQLNALRPEPGADHWDQLADRLDATDFGGSELFDESVRAAMSSFAADTSSRNWERMQSALEREESMFDHEVKEKVDNYEPAYDPATWPALKEKITEEERLHRRIMHAKIMEIAAILIAFVTLYNFFPAIQNAFERPQEQHLENDRPAEQASLNLELIPANTDAELKSGTATSAPVGASSENGSSSADAHSTTALDVFENRTHTENTDINIATAAIAHGLSRDALHSVDTEETTGLSTTAVLESTVGDVTITDVMPVIETDAAIHLPSIDPSTMALEEQAERPSFAQLSELHNTESQLTGNMTMADLGLKPSLFTTKGTRVSMSASVEINQLYIPADHFYSLGKQVGFSEKDIAAYGYSTGASILFDDGPWTFETGLNYAQKSFSPNRILHIGETFDVRTLDFQRINLNVINIPLLVHWNFDRKGRTRMYTVGGASMNIIASAHYDLIARDNSRNQSAAPSDPQYRKTSEEVQRIREHILDGAEFSAKSYLTVNAGFGVERLLNSKFSLFVQPTVGYQIPFFHISDQNGKHIQYISAQFGTRVRL